MHLFDRCLIAGHVIGDLAVAPCDGRIAVFEVGHVDVDDAVQQVQGRQRVVAARVVDDGQPQPARCCQRHGFDDLRDHVRRRHQVDVVTAHRLQAEHHIGNARRVVRLTGHLLADVVVLAEDTAQVAVGKEDRAGPAPTAQRVFLAHMRPEGCHPRPAGGLAGSQPPAGPVGAAFPGAQVARR